MGEGGVSYADFLARKSLVAPPAGMHDLPDLPSSLKPFQRAIVAWTLRRGRAAIFAGTGLGKTLMQLTWARAIADREAAPVLVLTPLAVAEQTVEEATKFGISGVGYARDQAAARDLDIVVTNYERFSKFDIGEFCGIVLDESGILKSQDGATRALLTEACRDLPWRLCCTATPAPNDFTELGQHAEFLGVMNFKEMLAMFFVHDGSVRANGGEADGWRLKRHAERDFWRWLASWSVMIRSPADLGFDASEYELPPLLLYETRVAVEYRPAAGMLFPVEARTLSERISARKTSAHDRVGATIGLVEAEPDEAWLIWCNLNAEADLIERGLPGALQVAGRHPVETKIARLLGFKRGEPRILISKPSLAGHGMHWAHCSRMAFVGLTDSFEQTYQAIRRCWRFGQTKPVHVHMVASELEGAVVANLRRKEADFDRMLDAMTGHMRDLMQEEVLGGRQATTAYSAEQEMEVPVWLRR